MKPAEIFFRITRVVTTRLDFAYHKLNIVKTKAPVMTGSKSLFCDTSSSFSDVRDQVLHFEANSESNSRDSFTEKPIQLFYKHPPITHKHIDWSKDPKTGRIAPNSFGKLIDYRDDALVGDIKYLWELGRHQFLIPLAVDVYYSADQDSEKALTMYLETWLDQNPVDQGIHWCSSLEAALRLIAWSFVHSILLSSKKKNGIFDLVSDSKQLQDSIFFQVKFIRSHFSRHSSANNHLIGELMGVWVTCNVFDFSHYTARWREEVQSELEHEAVKQQHSDGVNREQAIYYHLWVLEYLLLALLVGERFERPFSSAFVSVVGKMAGFLRNMCTDNGCPPNIGDADGGQVARFDHEVGDNPYIDLLNAVDKCIGVSEVDYSPYSKAYWYNQFLCKTNNKARFNDLIKLAEKKSVPLAYERGGYCLLGDKQIKICFKAGSLGYLSTAAHGHADMLSFCLAVNDHWWLTDQGTYSYHSEPQWRNYFRGTSSHNTLQVSRENQSEIGGAFLWLKKAKASMSALTSGPIQKIKGQVNSMDIQHSRALEFDSLNSNLTVLDTVDLAGISQKEEKEIQIRFHFHPRVNLEKVNEQSYIAQMPGMSERLEIKLSRKASWILLKGQTSPSIEGWYSNGYDHKVPSNVLVGTANLSHNTEFRSSIELS